MLTLLPVWESMPTPISDTPNRMYVNNWAEETGPPVPGSSGTRILIRKSAATMIHSAWKMPETTSLRRKPRTISTMDSPMPIRNTGRWRLLGKLTLYTRIDALTAATITMTDQTLDM